MTIAEINILHDKAKDKKDGIYSFRGNLWVVKGGNFIAYADPFGRCYQRMGSFNAYLGQVETYRRKDELKKWIKANAK